MVHVSQGSTFQRFSEFVDKKLQVKGRKKNHLMIWANYNDQPAEVTRIFVV